MGLVGTIFGVASAVVVLASALSPLAGARFLSIVLFVMWAVTKIWNYPTGTPDQVYLDTLLTFGGFLAALAVSLQNRRMISPRIVMACMVLTLLGIALFALPTRTPSAEANFAYQLTSNVLYGIALAVAATPGVRHGALAFRNWVSRYRQLGARPHPGRGRHGETKSALNRPDGSPRK